MRTKYIAGLLMIVFGILFGVITQQPDDKLHLIFCDVGQGDATLVVSGYNQVLIDGGPSSAVTKCLANHLPFWDREIEMVIATHADYDHLTGLIPVLERYRVRQIVSNSLTNESGVYQEFRQTVADKVIPVYSPQKGDRLKLGRLEFEVLWPPEKQGNEAVWRRDASPQILGQTTSANLNETSIATRLFYGRFQAFLAADIQAQEEKQLLDELTPTAVLKVAHHGSKYSSIEEFLAKLQPQLAVISVGTGNRYGHPAPETLRRLGNLEAKILRTDINGEVEIVSDGQNWRVK